MPAIPFALQLYTVRGHMEKDPIATLKAVKAAGYDFVELAGRAGYPPREFRKVLDDCGLTAISSHTSLEEIAKDPHSVVSAAQELGYKYLPFSGNAPDIQGWIGLGRHANEAGETLRKAGLQLCYHNHAHEFTRFEGKYAYDILMENAAAEHLAAEIDVFWVRFGGLDPVAHIRKYSGRCPLLHIKDMTAEPPYTFTEVGQGTIDMPAVFRAGQEAGTQWYIVEQDECARDPLESIRISAEYMRKQSF